MDLNPVTQLICNKHCNSVLSNCVYCEFDNLQKENKQLKENPQEYYRGQIETLQKENIQMKQKLEDIHNISFGDPLRTL